MNYIPLSELFQEVKIFYSSYFESGLDLDETIVLPKVRYILRKLSLPIHNKTSEVIEISNYKGELPIDFYKLELALACFKKTDYLPPNPLSPVEVTEVVSNYKINHCEINSCTNECGEYISLIQRVDGGTYYTYQDVKPLSISTRTHRSCTDNCLNKSIRSEDEFEISGNEITTNFCEGTIYLEYYQSMYTSEGLMIPDDEIIRNCLLENMKEVILDFLMINTTIPVSQLYQLQVSKATNSLREALNYIKTPSYDDVLDISKHYKKLFNKYYSKVVKNVQYNQSRKFI